MDTNVLFNFWQQDKTNVSLTCQLIASFERETEQFIIDEFVQKLPGIVKSELTVIVKLIELDIRFGHYEKAIQDCDAILPLSDQHSAILHLKILALFLMRQFDNVVNLAKSLTLLDETQIFVARSHYMLGELSEAINILDSLENKSAEVLGVLAMLHCDSGNISKAAQLAQHALSENPHQFEALLASAICSLNAQEVSTANYAIDLCMQQQPNNGRVLSLKGQVCLFEKQYSQAIQLFKQSLATMNQHIGTWHLLGWTQFILQDFNEAKLAFDESLLLDRNFAESHGGLACMLVKLGSINEATNVIDKALRLDRTSYSARYAQSLIFSEQGESKKAQLIIDEILKEQSPSLAQSFISIIQKIQ